MRFPVLFSLAVAGGLAAHSASAQSAPSNDQCQNATMITSGQLVSGNAVGAADDIPGLVGCQVGGLGANYPDVWYSFVATDPTVRYHIQAQSPTGGDSIALHLFSGSCNNQLALHRTACGIDTLSGSHNGLVVGDTYFLAINAGGSHAFQLGMQLGAPVVYPAQDCNQAVVLANLTTIQQGPMNMGGGADPNEVDPNNSCWGSGGERQPKWYRFTAGNTGLLEFNINPTDPQTDYDWAVWDVTTDALGCTTKGSAIACNWTGARGATGLSACPSLEPGYQGGDQFDNKTTMQTGANGPITVQAGHAYALLVDNFTVNSTGYTLTFGGACGTTGPVGPRPAVVGLGATFSSNPRPGMTVDFAPDVTVSNTIGISYFWSFGDGATSTLHTPSHTYATAGTYYTTLQVTDLLGTVATYARASTASITGVAEEVARAARLSLSPNPAHQTVRLTLADPLAPRVSAELYNSLGRLVRTTALPASSRSADLDLTGLRAGVYSVRVGGEVRRLVVSE